MEQNNYGIHLVEQKILKMFVYKILYEERDAYSTRVQFIFLKVCSLFALPEELPSVIKRLL